MSQAPSSGPGTAFRRGLLASVAAMLAIMAAVTVVDILVGPVRDGSPDITPLIGIAYGVGWLAVIAVPPLLVIRPEPDRQARSARAAGVLAGAAGTTMLGPALLYTVFTAAAHPDTYPDTYDMAFWYGLAFVATILVGVPAGILMWLRRRG